MEILIGILTGLCLLVWIGVCKSTRQPQIPWYARTAFTRHFFWFLYLPWSLEQHLKQKAAEEHVMQLLASNVNVTSIQKGAQGEPETTTLRIIK